MKNNETIIFNNPIKIDLKTILTSDFARLALMVILMALFLYVAQIITLLY